MESTANGRDTGTLDPGVALEIRQGIGRLHSGAGELLVIAMVMPVFLLGLELATEGLSVADVVVREEWQRPLDRALFVAYAVLLLALALRARLGAARARRLLPSLLSDSPSERVEARERLVRLAGPRWIRRMSERLAERGCLLVLLLGIASVVGWVLLEIPNPLWLTIFIGTLVAMDVRWRALVADAANQVR